MKILRFFLVMNMLLISQSRPGGKGRTPILGWNTWCTQNKCGVDWCTSEEVLDVASHIKSSGMLAIGYDHINLDDCWGVRNKTTKEIMGDPTRFPEGMEAFIAKLHALGFKFGLYTDIGENGCHHPFTGSWPYYKEDALTFQKWKVDYVKFDGCDKPPNHSAEELTCQMSNILNETGRDFWFNFHCWHNANCSACGNSFRMATDHHDNWGSTSGIIDKLKKREDYWGPDPDYGWPDPDFVYTGGEGCGQHSDPGVRCPGQTDDEYISEFSIWAIAGGQILISSDPRNMSALQKHVWFNTEILDVYNDTSGFRSIKFVSYNDAIPKPHQNSCNVSVQKQISGTPCNLNKNFGCFDGNMSMWVDQGCRALFQCDGIHDLDCESVNRSYKVCKCTLPPPGPAEVWLRPLSDGGAAVALHNPNSLPQDITVQFADVPDRKWDNMTKLHARDLWAREDLHYFNGSFTAKQVPKHGTVVIKLTS